MFFMLLTMFMSLSFILPLMNTPLSLGVIILIMSLITAAFIAVSSSTWFALILFIIYISGMLIMFSYFAAITPNQKTSAPLLIFILMFLLPTTLFLLKQTYIPHLMMMDYKTPPLLFYFMTLPQTPILLILASILLLALIFVVKIARPNYGPLRPFM
uniref:NADH dehydrogenase subunit 6 n=1 Tax=Neoamphitrite affinis TaxID=2716569 RepID=A0A8F9WHZ6_9ANNE|nr:NADH dehydrogenase subunit 6 [Neoamphitrite affinis]